MNIITLTQPWATLVAIGAKRIETRSWATPYRGPIAIHAGAGLADMTLSDYAAMCRRPPFRDALLPQYPLAGIWMRNERMRLCYDDPLPRGAIVAVARLVDCQRIVTGVRQFFCFTQDYGREDDAQVYRLTDQERAFGDYAPGRFAWLLADVRPLRTPLPYRGAQGLRRLPADVAALFGEVVK